MRPHGGFFSDTQGRVRRGLITPMLWVYALVLCAAVWTYSGLHALRDYRSTRASEDARLQSVSRTLVAEIQAMLGDGVGAAVAAVNELDTQGGIARASDAQLSSTLAHMLTGGDYVRALFIATPNRFGLIARSGRWIAGAPPADWRLPANPPARAAVWVGAPVADPDHPRKRLVPVARWVRQGASASGWAGALFSFDALAEVYRQPASESGVGLFGTDGATLALVAAPERRASAPDDQGRRIGTTPIFRDALAHLPHGMLEGLNPFTGRIVRASVASIPGYPMFVGAVRDRAAIFASWNQQARELFAVALAFTTLVGVATLLLQHFTHALAEREQHYRTLFDNAAFGAFVLEGERFIDANRTSASMFGVADPRELRGLTPWDLSPASQPDGTPSLAHAGQQIASALAHGSASFEWLHQRLDTGEPFHATVDISSLESGGRTLTLAVLHDVTERKRADAERERMVRELQELAGALIRLQDDARRRIGRDLHDATGQVLAALEMKLDRVVRIAAGSAPSVLPLLEECAQLARQCSSEIRTASYLLHPPLLDEIGLVSALRWLADGLRQRSGLTIQLDLPASMARLPREHELALFRAAQEALTNVHRHSMSQTATIRLWRDAAAVVLEVEDTGRGFAAAADGSSEPTARTGVGLAGLRERMRQLGGTLTVHSSVGGTRVHAEIGLKPTEPTSNRSAEAV
ncbi:MAG TPA: ATP-binding protein [Steroidobacteraceae bacterium]|nr:ATP-binding protein [Steroidobacteraceae bacterium]